MRVPKRTRTRTRMKANIGTSLPSARHITACLRAKIVTKAFELPTIYLCDTGAPTNISSGMRVGIAATAFRISRPAISIRRPYLVLAELPAARGFRSHITRSSLCPTTSGLHDFRKMALGDAFWQSVAATTFAAFSNSFEMACKPTKIIIIAKEIDVHASIPLNLRPFAEARVQSGKSDAQTKRQGHYGKGQHEQNRRQLYIISLCFSDLAAYF